MIAALAMASVAAATGSGPTVTMPGKLFSPPHVSALSGESVAWRNDDSSRHAIRAEDGSFDSGVLRPGDLFEQRFDATGVTRYFCTIHRSMRGSVEVADIALRGPAEPVPVGGEAVLDGRAPSGTGSVVLEPLGSTAEPDSDGRFQFRVTADRPMTLRARAGDRFSAKVFVPVAPLVRATARRHGERIVVRAHVEPAQPGALVVVERYRRERFGFVRARRRAVALDGRSRARVVVGSRSGRAVRLRVRLAMPVGGYARAASDEVTVSGRGRHPKHHH